MITLANINNPTVWIIVLVVVVLLFGGVYVLPEICNIG